MVQGTLRHSGHRGDKISLSNNRKSVVIYSKVVGGNLSQWIHPSALPGLPRTSGTIVSSSRNTSRFFSPLPTEIGTTNKRDRPIT
ncbi:hypothetical protein D4764_08G0007430 [Takifugu flavidus]|uniref:Uncharacterized protein n=1 Tax=Takifugu flavidus TaxID=433684 RepID=A0A5C6MNS3_9TELE|nr:hypothetical protein D4764_08G0007430 [Takifugu flavidus]